MKSTIEELIRIYQQVKSIRKTAELTGYSKSGVQFLLHQNDIKTFPRSRKGCENSIRKSFEKLDISDPKRLIRNINYMSNLYIDKKMSIPEISKLLNVSNGTVLTGLKQCGIKRRSKNEALMGKSRPNSQGSKNINWKGGLSGWRKLARGRLNEHFVRPIMQRDNFICQWCSSKTNIVVHHCNRSFMEIVNVVRQKINESNVEEFVNAIISEHKLEDGITLCKLCHDKYHKEHGK